MSRLTDAIKHYRQLLLQHEAQAEATLQYAHQQTLASIKPVLDHLYQQIAEKQKAGEDISLSWLYEQKRLETITQWITQQINHFAALTQMQVGQMQSQGVQLGQLAAQSLLQSMVPPGINWSFGIPSPQAIQSMIGATQKGSPLSDLFSGFGKEAAEKASQALITGVTLGYNPREMAPSVQDALNISRYRALTIARTEMLRSYRSANLETFRANDDVVGNWIWQAALDRTTCAACVAMNGTEHELSEDMASHVNCRCVQVPKTKGWDEILSPLGIDTSGIPDTTVELESGSDWFDRQSEATQKAILGPTKYAAWQDNVFTLQDIVGYNHDKDWGKSIFEKPLKELVKK